MANTGDFIIGRGKYTEYRYRKDSDKDYIWNVHEHTDFMDKWGIRAVDLAKQEGVSTDAINMRVHLFGTPFQRKAKPTLCEQIHGKTDYELGLELNLHPQSIRRRVRLHKDAYFENPFVHEHPHRGKILSPKKDWRENTKKTKFWLHPLHPDYPHEARKGL